MTTQPSGVIARLRELARIGAHERGIDRALATPAERAARLLFAKWARNAGYALAQDRVGNLFARRSGADARAAPILVGSHLDTVPTGGAYDGAYGVVGALCALELLDARGIATAHPVEAVAWAGEEGSRFPLGCLGSSVFAGIVTADDALALADDSRVPLSQALADPECGLLAEVPVREDHRVAAYLELHVEQGPVLERAGAHLGLVTAIAAQNRYRVVVEGESGHAGTVPMEQRRDALCAASELVLGLESAAKNFGESVVTVGRMTVEPNGTNVIPARVTFSVDARSSDQRRVDTIDRALKGFAADTRRRRNVEVRVERLEARKAAPMDAALREAVRHAAASLGQPMFDVASGAGHDARCLSLIAPAAMIFVPSIGGASHVAEERTGDADLELGVQVLSAAIVEAGTMLRPK